MSGKHMSLKSYKGKRDERRIIFSFEIERRKLEDTLVKGEKEQQQKERGNIW